METNGVFCDKDIEEYTGERPFYCNFLRLATKGNDRFGFYSYSEYICTLKRKPFNHCDGKNCIFQRMGNILS